MRVKSVKARTLVAAAAVLWPGYMTPFETVAAQSTAQRAPIVESPGSFRAMAPIDLTGYWVTVISEDWRLRMITPPKGNLQGFLLNEAGIKLGNAWDPVADEASGNQCKAYGAAAIMRSPTRLHITWHDDSTLKFEFDHGRQTRLVYSDASRRAGPRTWQGHAIGQWIDTGMRRSTNLTRGGAPDIGPPTDLAQGRRGGAQGRGGRGGAGAPPAGRGDPANQLGALRVVTTNLRPQYYRQNGVPVSQDAIIAETFDRLTGPVGDEWLIVHSRIEDSTYLREPVVTSTHFKREPDGSQWRPTPCEVERPPVPRLTQTRVR